MRAACKVPGLQKSILFPPHRKLKNFLTLERPRPADGRIVAWVYIWHGRFWLDFVTMLPFIYLVGGVPCHPPCSVLLRLLPTR